MESPQLIFYNYTSISNKSQGYKKEGIKNDMKKALINIIVIIVTGILVGYLVFTGFEVKNNEEVENELSNKQIRYEEVIV